LPAELTNTEGPLAFAMPMGLLFRSYRILQGKNVFCDAPFVLFVAIMA